MERKAFLLWCKDDEYYSTMTNTYILDILHKQSTLINDNYLSEHADRMINVRRGFKESSTHKILQLVMERQNCFDYTRW